MTVPLLFDDAEARERWRLGSSPLGKSRPKPAVLPDGWRGIETLTTADVTVEMMIEPGGEPVLGWMSTHFRTAPRTYWTLEWEADADGVRAHPRSRSIVPMFWRPARNEARAAA